MIHNAFARLGFFFRPFRRGAYQHAPSIEELYVIRLDSRSRIARWWRKFLLSLSEIKRR